LFQIALGKKLRKKQSGTLLQRKRKATGVNKDIRKSLSSPVNNLKSKTSNTRSDSDSGTVKITNGYSDDSDEEADSSQRSFVQMTTADTNTSPGLLSWNTSKSTVTRRRSLRSHPSPHNDIFTSQTSPSHLNSENSASDNSHGNSTLDSSYKDTTKYTKLSQRELKNGGDCYRRKAFQNLTRQESSKYVTKDSDVIENNKNSTSKSFFGRIKSYFSSSKSEQQQAGDFKQTKKQAPRSWSLYCAYFLPVGTLIFFCTLGLLYVTMRTDDIGQPLLHDQAKVG